MKALEIVFKVFAVTFSIGVMIAIVVVAYFFGYYNGIYHGRNEISGVYEEYLDGLYNSLKQNKEPVIVEIPNTNPPVKSNSGNLLRPASWGGPDLWKAVNEKRITYGVSPLSQKDDLCTVASIRLNELLELGKLDGHEGFSSLPERRADIKTIYDKYGTIAEFLAAGGESAEETVSMWDNTLAHKKLLTGGEYVWGCIYAQNSFAVAITAF